MKKKKIEKKLNLNKLKIAQLSRPDLVQGGSLNAQVFLDDDGSDGQGSAQPTPPPPPPCTLTSLFPVDQLG
ncbi:class I lanthipeptide [uncultured Aquimarina sp.]|uniref:class I lanthipeptide n=1 Tax=uncultured Aquimarina sp. TaxID=575652 RepID=UPI00261F2386|nr:class I lanthipeptide [uncultured Aquimarina sp.]